MKLNTVFILLPPVRRIDLKPHLDHPLLVILTAATLPTHFPEIWRLAVVDHHPLQASLNQL